MRCIRLDCAWMGDREAVHDYLAQALGFPSWYGRNLDALYDVLTERGEPLRLLVRNREALAEYAEDLLRTLAEAAAENPALELVYE